MTEMLCTLTGMVLGGALVALGWVLGSGGTGGAPPRPAVRAEAAPVENAPGEKALERLEADQRAFSALMGYSADVAYGLTRAPLTEE